VACAIGRIGPEVMCRVGPRQRSPQPGAGTNRARPLVCPQAFSLRDLGCAVTSRSHASRQPRTARASCQSCSNRRRYDSRASDPGVHEATHVRDECLGKRSCVGSAGREDVPGDFESRSTARCRGESRAPFAGPVRAEPSAPQRRSPLCSLVCACLLPGDGGSSPE